MGYLPLVAVLAVGVVVYFRRAGSDASPKRSSGFGSRLTTKTRSLFGSVTRTDNLELGPVVEAASDAVVKGTCPLGNKTITPMHVSIQVPRQTLPLVRANFQDITDAVNARTHEKFEAASLEWPAGRALQLNHRVFIGQPDARATFEEPAGDPFASPLTERGDTVNIEVVERQDGLSGVTDRGSRAEAPDPANRRVPTPSPYRVPRTPDPGAIKGIGASLLTDGVPGDRVAIKVVGTRVGRDPSCDIQLPFRAGLSGDHLIISPAGPMSVEIVDHSSFGTSVKLDGTWCKLTRNEPVTVVLPATIMLGTTEDVLIDVSPQ